MPPVDPHLVRPEFPSLARRHGDQPVVYLDGPGGTQVPRRVIEAVTAYYQGTNANEGGAFATSAETDAMTAEARQSVAELLGAPGPDGIRFGANMTTLTFHLSRSIGARLAPGDEIVVTRLDHEANVSPWHAVAADRGLVVRTVDVRPSDGTLALDDLDRFLGPRTRLVAVGCASNALGTINPVHEIVRRTHAAGALSYLDAVHYTPHGLVDVTGLDADFLVCSAYKWFGPHVGVLYGKPDILADLPTYKVRPAHDRIETGTLNFEGLAGTSAAVDYLRSIGIRFGEGPMATARDEIAAGMAAICAHERSLSERFIVGLSAIRGIRLWGIADLARLDERTPTFALTIDGVSPRAAAEALAAQGIFAWDGDFYAQGLVERLGLAASGGLLRIGAVHYNTLDEIDRVLDVLEGIAAGTLRSAG
jgi:cysteine desulfurase family protein (TIGR01976 family)